MTDNEIIKALKDKIEFENFDENGYAVVDIEKLKNALDLINRQKAKNEKKDVEIDILIRKKGTLKDEVAELKAEIERLTKENDILNGVIDRLVKESEGNKV